nr:zinc finger, CCHC-type [Tanacetum cinerariifolium]
MAEDATSKKFLGCNFTNYKMTNSRSLIKQYNELLGILGRFTQHKMNMDEAIQVSCIIEKLLSFWKDFMHTLKHQKEELTLIELDSYLRIKKSLRVQDNDKTKGNNVAGPSVLNMMQHNNSFRRWQKKVHFLLSSMSVVYVLTAPIPKDGRNATLEQIRKRAKWDNDNYVCRGLIINGMSDPLFDIYQNVKSSKEL